MTTKELETILEMLNASNDEISRLGMIMLTGYCPNGSKRMLPQRFVTGKPHFLDTPVYRIHYKRQCVVITNRVFHYGPKGMIARQYHNFGRIPAKHLHHDERRR